MALKIDVSNSNTYYLVWSFGAPKQWLSVQENHSQILEVRLIHESELIIRLQSLHLLVHNLLDSWNICEHQAKIVGSFHEFWDYLSFGYWFYIMFKPCIAFHNHKSGHILVLPDKSGRVSLSSSFNGNATTLHGLKNVKITVQRTLQKFEGCGLWFRKFLMFYIFILFWVETVSQA